MTNSRRNQSITTRLALASVILAVLTTLAIVNYTAASGNESPIAGDPRIYNEITTAILDGNIPYVGVAVEHLPGALVPMLLAQGISRITNINFEMLWLFAMSGAFVASVVIASNFPVRFDSGRRYLLLSLPLLPLVLFRVEPWLMLWVVVSLGFAFQSLWKRSAIAAVVASLTKGWPVILLALPFRRGHRRLALVAGIATFAILIGVSLLPGFREGRSFQGIHTETFVGSLLLVYRWLTGVDPQLVASAGAIYVAASTWAIFVNAILGLSITLVGLRALTKTAETGPMTIAIGLAVLGIVLSSPLFSAQFMFWLVPFVMFLGSGHRRLYIAASTLTLATIIWWDPLGLTWSVLVLGRNSLLIVLAIVWALSLRQQIPALERLEHVA